MSTQLELDMPALEALATSQDACAAIAAGRRPGVTRLVVRNGQITAEPVGFPGRGPADGMGRLEIDYSPHRLKSTAGGFGEGRRYLEHDPIPGLRMTPADAQQEIERQTSEEDWDE